MKCAFKLNRQHQVHHARGKCHGNNNKQSRITDWRKPLITINVYVSAKISFRFNSFWKQFRKVRLKFDTAVTSCIVSSAITITQYWCLREHVYTYSYDVTYNLWFIRKHNIIYRAIESVNSAKCIGLKVGNIFFFFSF